MTKMVHSYLRFKAILKLSKNKMIDPIYSKIQDNFNLLRVREKTKVLIFIKNPDGYKQGCGVGGF